MRRDGCSVAPLEAAQEHVGRRAAGHACFERGASAPGRSQAATASGASWVACWTRLMPTRSLYDALLSTCCCDAPVTLLPAQDVGSTCSPKHHGLPVPKPWLAQIARRQKSYASRLAHATLGVCALRRVRTTARVTLGRTTCVLYVPKPRRAKLGVAAESSEP
jgi:hypothetical protein